MKHRMFARLTLRVAAAVLILGMGSGVAFAQNPPTDIGVNWSGIFTSDGSQRDEFDDLGAPGANGTPDAIDVYGGIDAIFIEDRTSGGSVVDISALDRAGNLEDFDVYNGPVLTPHDLGNAYLFVRMEGADLVLEGRVERLIGATPGVSFVELELSNEMIGARVGRYWPNPPGSPPEFRWKLDGQRSIGDLLVRMNLDGGTLTTVEIKRWDDPGSGPGYQPLVTHTNTAQDACFSEDPAHNFCSGSLSAGESISNGDIEQIYEPDGFVELSVNLGQLLGGNPDFTTVQVCSPEDIGFGTFMATGRYASN